MIDLFENFGAGHLKNQKRKLNHLEKLLPESDKNKIDKLIG